MRRLSMAAGAMIVLVAATGCSSKLKERNSLLAAENTDLRQRTQDLEQQYTQAQAESDRAQAEVSRQQAALAQAQAQAQATQNQNAAYQQQLAQMQSALADATARADKANRDMLASLRNNDAPKTSGAPQVEAFRRDLQARLSQYGVTGVDVDIRTAQDGRARVAVVLQNSFRAGMATLSSNPSAVKAIVGLGKLIVQAYPGSRVTVEGHTDSDPISKSKWESNEALSLARADEVKKLLRQSGVSDGISAVGMGARQPVAKGSTARAKAQNRRVEIYIVPSSM